MPRTELNGDAIVIRFRPISPDSVLRSAEREFRRAGRYGLSVFADVPRDGESADAVITRLLAASELAGMSPQDNPKYYVCSRAEQLLHEGFTFVKDGDDDELAEHYTVDLGDEPRLVDVERFLGAFDRRRR